MSDDATLPPRKPRTLRTLLQWLAAHPEFSVPAATFVLGAVLGAWAF